MSPPEKLPRLEEGVHQDERLRAARLTVGLFFGIGLLVLLAAGSVQIYVGVTREPGPPRAAIVDQLSLTFPNPDFIEEATATLEQAGFVVDYYPGEEVTVDFFRELPNQDFDYLILRTHSALTEWKNDAPTGKVSLIFTGELAGPSHLEDFEKRTLALVRYYESGETYFGIGPHFVNDSMKGSFDDTRIVLMGCEVLTSSALAQAFIDKGAEAVVGWDGTVTADHTDAATLNMLEHHLVEGLSLQEAAEVAMEEVGPDPFYESVLVSYPPDG